MTLTAADRSVLRDLYPFSFEGVAPADLDDILDTWFAEEHFDNNPVYSWADNESHTS